MVTYCRCLLLCLIMAVLVAAENETILANSEEVMLLYDMTTPVSEVVSLTSAPQYLATSSSTRLTEISESTPVTVPNADPTMKTASTTKYLASVHHHHHHHHHHQGSRWGPYFEEGAAPQNITARVGSTVLLDCKIGMLHDKTVTWLHRRHDSIHLLTVGRHTYSSDERITLSFRYPNNWRLEIQYVTGREEGRYECQVATHPPRVKIVNLKVTAPVVVIMDENSHEVSERYYKAGSALELMCLATQVEQPGDYVTWRRGAVTLTKGIGLNTSLSAGSIAAVLRVERVEKQHSGNYTCAVGNLASATVAIHILNGELPAAVHHGNLACDPLHPTWIWVAIFMTLHMTVSR